MLSYNDLTNEQRMFIDRALQRYNILVEACVGSGKTTAIQTLCGFYPPTMRVLYLTYNKLLKLDAQNKIKSRNIKVTNYHGFAMGELCRYGIRAGISEAIVRYNEACLPTENWDVLILDEYQDIEYDISDMLMYLKSQNPNMQIIAVGDICQKIYDKTTLDVESFIHDLLGPNLFPMEFTQCFRLNSELCDNLSDVWDKKIVGVNPNCDIEIMDWVSVLSYLQTCRPEQLLVLGANRGQRNWLLNRLEDECPAVFNKNTVWSKITENDGGASQPRPDCAIFTTYDGCKGMERDICVIFDWTADYWNMRLDKPGVKYEILRNIFCVAASRGKRKVIFVKSDASQFLGWDIIKETVPDVVSYEDQAMSAMFDFKYIEDVEDAWRCLECNTIRPVGQEIAIPVTDGLIDLSPCIGLYQELTYFENSQIDQYIESWFLLNRAYTHLRMNTTGWSLDQKILYLTMLETGQNRYFNQVQIPFVTEWQWQQIVGRLAEVLPSDAVSQGRCTIPFYQGRNLCFTANGFFDVLLDRTIYELKFVSSLSHIHMLQCALYVAAQYLQRGILWNVKTDEMIEIKIPDRDKFLSCVAKASTKGNLTRYDWPKDRAMREFIQCYKSDCDAAWDEYKSGRLKLTKMSEFFANRGLFLPGTGRNFMAKMKKLHAE